MKLVDRENGVFDYHVFGAVCGRLVDAVVLDSQDFELLLKAPPEHVKSWLEDMYCRFGIPRDEPLKLKVDTDDS